MKKLRVLLLPLLVTTFPLIASADPWKDESGHGRGHKHGHREYKEEYWDGNCKVERKLEKNGDYKEERKCKGPRHSHYERPRHRHHEPAVVHVPVPPPVIVEPGITVHGTVRIPH